MVPADACGPYAPACSEKRTPPPLVKRGQLFCDVTLSSILCCNDLIALIGDQPGDRATRRLGMHFDPIATAYADMILQLALRGLETFAARNVDVFVVPPADDDLHAWNTYVDPRMVESSLAALNVRQPYQN